MTKVIEEALCKAHDLIVNVPFDAEYLEWANAVDAEILEALQRIKVVENESIYFRG